jgi:Flp pilus assembly protein TadG
MRIHIYKQRENGVAAVEFALIASVLFALLFGMMEMSRLLFYWNTATEATRMGARMAVVCTMDDANIKARMTLLFPVIGQNEIRIDYLPAGCSTTTCEQVTVRIESVKSIQTFIPFVPLSVTLPPFLTTLPRESMASANNPACS